MTFQSSSTAHPLNQLARPQLQRQRQPLKRSTLRFVLSVFGTLIILFGASCSFEADFNVSDNTDDDASTDHTADTNTDDANDDEANPQDASAGDANAGDANAIDSEVSVAEITSWAGFVDTGELELLSANEITGEDRLVTFAFTGSTDEVERVLAAAEFSGKPGQSALRLPADEWFDLAELDAPVFAVERWENPGGTLIDREVLRGTLEDGQQLIYVWAFAVRLLTAD